MRERLRKLVQSKMLEFQLHRHGVRIAGHVRGTRIRIRNLGAMEIGDWTSLASYPQGEPFITSLNTWTEQAVLHIGERCILNGTVIHVRNRVTIGPWCMFGPGVVILDNNSHSLTRDPIERRQGLIEDAPVELGANVWIGMRSIVTKGVTIGDNTIVAAGSVVVRDLPGNVVAGGNPCQVIREL